MCVCSFVWTSVWEGVLRVDGGRVQLILSVIFTPSYLSLTLTPPISLCLPASPPFLLPTSSLPPKQLAMDLVHKDKAYIRGSGQRLTVVRAGLGASATVGGTVSGTQE